MESATENNRISVPDVRVKTCGKSTRYNLAIDCVGKPRLEQDKTVCRYSVPRFAKALRKVLTGISLREMIAIGALALGQNPAYGLPCNTILR